VLFVIPIAATPRNQLMQGLRGCALYLVLYVKPAYIRLVILRKRFLTVTNSQPYQMKINLQKQIPKKETMSKVICEESFYCFEPTLL
jgi:hypothetical protein